MQNIAAKKPVSQIRMKNDDLLTIESLTADTINDILDLADHYVIQNRRKSQKQALLKGLVLFNLFFENSTRTRLSFELAAKRLGADVINLSTEGSSIQKGESLSDTLKTVNAMRPDIAVIRAKADGSAQLAADVLHCPVINAGDGTNEHPTQALLDALTLRQHFGRLKDLKIAICGDIKHSRVAHSNIILLQKMGATVTLAGPRELLPDAIKAAPDMDSAVKNADAVMVLRIQKERLTQTLSFTEDQYFKDFGLTRDRLALAQPQAVVLHPGPMNRGVEIDPAIADDPARSLITLQVEMGVAVRMACLDLLTRTLRSV